MRFDLQSLQKFCKIKVKAEELAELYTNAGLEVESIEGNIIDIAIPPNRADCLSFKGLAREAGALLGEDFDPPEIDPAPEAITDTIDLEVLDHVNCPKYLGRIVKGVNNNIETPEYIRTALEIADISLISPIVDITNYVMLELGQPLHAFDLNKINVGIVVRPAKADEKITLLDDSYRELNSEILVIADKQQALAIAGVMGGVDSGISLQTQDILLEVAYFNPVSIRMSARNLGLQTDSSYRFERCIDPEMQVQVMEHVTNLILEIAGGSAGPIVVSEEHAHLPQPIELTLRSDRLERILGMEFSTNDCSDILRALGMDVRPAADLDDMTVEVPTFRQDIGLEIDLVEEIARINGYDKIPETTTVGTLDFVPNSEAVVSERRVYECLLNRGYSEAIVYSFIDSELVKTFAEPIADEWVLTNPISNDMDIMRPSLLPGLVQAVAYNLNRQQARVKLFEIGLRFEGRGSDLKQIKTIAGICTGNYYAENWANGERTVDFYDIKQDLAALFDLSGKNRDIQLLAKSVPALQPGQSADIIVAESKVGVIGALHPAIQQKLEIQQPVYMFSVDYDAVTQGKVSEYRPISKYPAVRRDLALLVAEDLAFDAIENSIREQVGNLLLDMCVFDVYAGKGIPAGNKSLGIGITLQDQDRTLHEKEVNDIFGRLLSTLENKFNAVLR